MSFGLRQRMEDHVQQLADEYGCALVVRPRANGSAVGVYGRSDATVTISPVRSRSTYFMALHEFGHVNANRAPAKVEDYGLLYVEVEAWDWAYYHAEEEGISPSARTMRVIRSGLTSYVHMQVGDPPSIHDPEPLATWRRRIRSGDPERVPEYGRAWYEQAWGRLMGPTEGDA